MQELRGSGVPRNELSKDETMQKEHIGNIYREMDAGSKRMKDEIIGNGDQSHEEICCKSSVWITYALDLDTTTLTPPSPYFPLLRLLRTGHMERSHRRSGRDSQLEELHSRSRKVRDYPLQSIPS